MFQLAKGAPFVFKQSQAPCSRCSQSTALSGERRVASSLSNEAPSGRIDTSGANTRPRSLPTFIEWRFCSPGSSHARKQYNRATLLPGPSALFLCECVCASYCGLPPSLNCVCHLQERASIYHRLLERENLSLEQDCSLHQRAIYHPQSPESGLSPRLEWHPTALGSQLFSFHSFSSIISCVSGPPGARRPPSARPVHCVSRANWKRSITRAELVNNTPNQFGARVIGPLAC